MIRQALLVISNGFMMACLIVLSMVAIFTEDPKTRPPFIRVLGAFGLASLLLHVGSRVWPYLTRRRILLSQDTSRISKSQ